jgi:cell division protein FtsQ
VLGGWAVVAVSGAVGPLVADWFEIREVRVSGTSVVARQEVLERLQVAPRATLLSVSPTQLVARLEAHPWIKHAMVSRVPFHTLAVRITERRAAAVLRAPSLTLLLDDEGRALSVLAERDDPGLPILVGLDPNRLLLGEALSSQAAHRGVTLAGLLARSLEGRPEIDVSDPEHAVAYLKGLRFQFGPSSLEEQWDRYQAVEPIRHAGVGDGHDDTQHEIDLRYSDKVILRERG